MWIFDVAMNTWMRGFVACRTASHARSTSLNAVRDSPVMTGPDTDFAIASTDFEVAVRTRSGSRPR